MSNTNPSKIIASLLENLNPKQKEVISLRFGLKDGKRMTLEAIGDKYDITRERVRQIEEDALNNLRKPGLIGQVEEFLNVISKHIDNHGGVKKELALFEKDASSIFAGQKLTINPKATIHLLLTLDKRFVRHPESKDWHSFWATDKSIVEHAKSVATDLHEKLKDHKQPISEDALISLATESAKSKNIPTSKDALMSYVSLAKNIESNVFGHFGLAHWPEISPRGMKDKAFLVLKKLGKPLHFTLVAKEIEKSGLTKKSAHPQTVHNELIKDSRFVLVGRGTYALADWGYAPGTIKDVIVGIMNKSANPLAKEEIVSKVMSQRQVKENTILLNLQNRKIFKKTEAGKYVLA